MLARIIKTAVAGRQSINNSARCQVLLSTNSLSSASKSSFFSIFHSKAKRFNDSMIAADSALKKGSFQEAIYHLNESLKQDDPAKSQADTIIKKMAMTYFQMNQLDKSIACYLQLKEKYPNDEHIQMSVGLLYGKTSNVQGALQVFEDVLQKSPHNPQLTKQAALYCEELRQFDKAVKYYKLAIDLAPQDAQNYINLGNIYIRDIKDYEKALEYLLKAAEIDGNNLDLNYNIGMSYFEIKNLKLSLQYLNKCLEINPSFHDAKKNIRYITALLK